MSEEETIEQEVAEQDDIKHYVLITKNSCPACNKALKLLKEKHLNFVYTDMENAPKALASTKNQLSWETVPMIWEQDIDWSDGVGRILGNNFIGGLEQLEDHFSQNDD
jgi:glutaredoxin